jgi:hypothetical protein
VWSSGGNTDDMLRDGLGGAFARKNNPYVVVQSQVIIHGATSSNTTFSNTTSPNTNVFNGHVIITPSTTTSS